MVCQRKERYIEKRSQESRSSPLGLAACIWLAIGIIVFGGIATWASWQHSLLKHLEATPLSQEVTQIEDVGAVASSIQQEVTKSLTRLRELADIGRRLVIQKTGLEEKLEKVRQQLRRAQLMGQVAEAEKEECLRGLPRNRLMMVDLLRE